MKKYNKKYVVLGLVILVAVVLVILGLTYAFFVANVEGNPSATPTIIETADLRLLFNDTEVIIIENALPGISATKTFTVTNIGNREVKYEINIKDVINTFINNELIYTLTSTNGGTTTTNSILPTSDGTLVEGIIAPGITQTYTITINFIETGLNQNINQGAVFSGKLQINAKTIYSDEITFEIEETSGSVLKDETKDISLIGLNYGDVTCSSSDILIAECNATKEKVSILGKSRGTTDITIKENLKNIELTYSIRVFDVTLLLSETNGEIVKTKTKTVNISGTDYGTLSCETSNASIATCSISGTVLTINGIELGNAIITVRESNINKTTTYSASIVLPKLYNQIQLDNIPQSDSTIDFTGVAGVGLYYTEDSATYGEDGQRIYYYRGNVSNNWVSLAGKYWRIVRTTSEKGVKLIYSGVADTTSSAFTSTTQYYNDSSNNKYYVGYTYNTSSYTGTQTNSAIKTAIDTWYTNNLNSYASYLSITAIYCNDRTEESAYAGTTTYMFSKRLNTDKHPSFACPSTNESRYTASTETGNGYLTKPIALLTGDEIYYAGGGIATAVSYITENATYEKWWTMTPLQGGNVTSMGVIGGTASTGKILPYMVNTGLAIRPVVSLKPCVIITGGNGSKTTPYVISTSAC